MLKTIALLYIYIFFVETVYLFSIYLVIYLFDIYIYIYISAGQR